MKKNRYAEPVRQTYAKETKMERFKFKENNGSKNVPKSKKKKHKKPKSAR